MLHVMNKTCIILIILLVATLVGIDAQKYFVSFTDKQNNDFSIEEPEQFLSQRSIERRTNQAIAITTQDLPVSNYYLDSLKNMDLRIYWSSKWFNGAIVESTNADLMDTISYVSFISDASVIYSSTGNETIQKFDDLVSLSSLKSSYEDIYGASYVQTSTVNGQYLHSADYEGLGMLIAVLDNGFDGVDELESYTHLWEGNQIIDTCNFVDPNQSVFETEGSHGTSVLSIMGGYIESEFKGSAPEASYILLRTEDDDSEYPIEEYNWVIAAEFADSAGVDVINSSLGYYQFDDSSFDYTYENMDGETSISVQGAEIAFSKGMVVVCSAGNEGNSSWKYIITPADGEHVLAVGAMAEDSTRASFSSYGPSYDERVKPDLAALGKNTALQSDDGGIEYGSGTSYSAPVVSGFVTCLWQANPELSSQEIIQLVKSNCHQYANPDDIFGYGIPNFSQALSVYAGVEAAESATKMIVTPNPFHDQITITNVVNKGGEIDVSIFDLTGKSVYGHVFSMQESITIDDLDNLSNGLYIIQLKYNQQTYAYKLYKK